MQHGPELIVVVIASAALAIGAAMRLFSQRLRFPYTIAMLLIGIGSGLALRAVARGGGEVESFLVLLGHGAEISPDLIIFVFLPMLIFESAYALDVHTFRNNLGAVMLLAGPALICSTVLVAGLMILVTGASWEWSWPAALAFGALISATDPVAVVAILRELGVSKRLATLIEGESLMNDGTSIVVFGVFLALLTGAQESFDGSTAVLNLLWVVTVGLAVGIGLAFLFSRWIEGLFNDQLSEITLTLVLAYSAMIIAEGFLHVSGVMAVVAAGLWMSGIGRTKVSPEISRFLHRFWETLGYIANTLIFFLVGLVIAQELERTTVADIGVILIAYAGVMAIRFALTHGFAPLANRLSDGVSTRDAVIVSWGGLRGAVSLALALVVAQQSAIDPELRRQILLVTAGVVLLTILVNGMTMARLLSWLGFDKTSPSELVAQLSAKNHVLERLRVEVDEASRSPDLKACHWDEVLERIARQHAEVAADLTQAERALRDGPAEERQAAAWRRVLALERQAYWEAFNRGMLGARAVRLLSRELDRQLDLIKGGDFSPPATRAPENAVRPAFVQRLLGHRGLGFEGLTLLHDLSRAEILGAERVLFSLDFALTGETNTLAQIRRTYLGYLRQGKERIEGLRANLPEVTQAIETRLAKRIELNAERDAYQELGERGILDEAALHTELHHVEHRMQALKRAATRVPIPRTVDLVAATPLFECLDAAALKLLAQVTEEMIVPKGTILFREGDQGDSMFVIARGAVHVVKEIEGEEVLLGVLGAGEIIGEMALLTGAPRTATGRAATPVTLGKVSRSGFERLLESQSTLRDRVWRGVAWRRFDNHLRTDKRFRHLDPQARRAWFEAGRQRSLRPGEQLHLGQRAGLVMVVCGVVEMDQTVVEGPALVPRPAEIACVEAAEVVLLTESDPSP